MSCATNDLALNEDYLYAFASRRTSCSMPGRTTADNDQFLFHVHVDEATGKVVVVLDVVVVVVAPNVGNVVGGTAILLGQ